MNICVAIIPPAPAIRAIEKAVSQYEQYLQSIHPKSQWHIPLVTTASVLSQEPLRQPFHQVVRILSLGEGSKAPSHNPQAPELWVRIQMTAGISALRESLVERIQESKHALWDAAPFTPHIRIGSFENIPPFGILDTPLAFTFSIREVYIIQTDPYEILGSITITP